MASISATKARTEFFDLIKDTINKHKTFHIHHRQGDVVLMSKEEYENLQETLDLLSVPGFRESIKKSIKQIEKGETYSMDDVFGKNK
jgi:antitoxin YefM